MTWTEQNDGYIEFYPLKITAHNRGLLSAGFDGNRGVNFSK